LLDDIERLLKRPLPRQPLPEFATGKKSSRYHDHMPSTQPQPPLVGGFDYSAPYQESVATPVPRPAVPIKSSKQVAALLGGLATKKS
jgi:hypothetical protein